MWILALISILGFAMYQLWRAIYSIFFHPLRSYPGPKLWAVSRLPWFWVSIQGRLCWRVQEMHEKYGPVIRIAPDELSYTTETAWKKIYGQKSPEFEKCLDGRGLAPVSRNGVTGIVAAPQEKHAVLRRAILPAFSERALREHEHVIQTYIAILVKQLHRAEGVQDISKWYGLTTFDIISALAFGEKGQCLENADQPWLNLINERAKSIVWYQLAIYYGFDQFIDWIAPSYTMKSRQQHMKQCAAKVKARLLKKDSPSDFMSYIVDNETDSLTNFELVVMASAFIVAGSGTSHNCLAGTTFFLLSNPATYSRLVAEIRGSFKNEEDIDVSGTSKLPYLRACVEESLRMFPPAPSTLPRFTPKSGEEVDGRFIPGGVAVGVHQLSSGLAETNFHRAMEFLPERWLELPENSPFAGDHRSASQPFSYGPRSCIGKNLGYQEIKVTLSRVLWSFDLEMIDKSDSWWKEQKTFPFWEKKELMVKISPRAQ